MTCFSLTSLLLVAEEAAAAAETAEKHRASQHGPSALAWCGRVLRGGGGVLDFGGPFGRPNQSPRDRRTESHRGGRGPGDRNGAFGALCSRHPRCLGNSNHCGHHGAFQSGQTAAEYDAKVEVPVARTLVMVTARETVQEAFLAAGRPTPTTKTSSTTSPTSSLVTWRISRA